MVVLGIVLLAAGLLLEAVGGSSSARRLGHPLAAIGLVCIIVGLVLALLA